MRVGTKQKKRVVVVGGGVGGLVSALELAERGLDVTLFERHDVPGGKMRRVEIEGRQIDIGPTVLTMRWVFDLIFSDVDDDFRERVPLLPAEKVAEHAWDDGARLPLFFNVERSRDAIKAFAGMRDADAFMAFSKYTRSLYRHAHRTFMVSPDPSIRHMARTAGPKAMGTIFRIDPFRKMARAINGFFRDRRLQQLFMRYATYYGSSPFAAPATLNLIAHVEQQGVWLPVHGMVSIAEALRSLTLERGGRIQCGVGVKEIRLERGVVEGVLLEDDTFVAADAVVYNGDISAIGTGLLGEEVRRAASPTPLRRRSLSALVGALVTETSGFPLSSHNVFFHTAPYKKEFTDIFKKGRLPTHPTVYVRAQDRDRCQRQGDQGPQKGGEKERIFFIINAPPSGDVSPLANEEIELCLHSAQALLHRSGLSVDLDQENRRIYSPTEFAKRFPGTGGALYGAATHAMTAAIKRRGVRSKVSGLYFAGGSVHPGAGVPMAALGGRQAANALLSDFGLTKLSPLTDMPGGTSTG